MRTAALLFLLPLLVSCRMIGQGPRLQSGCATLEGKLASQAQIYAATRAQWIQHVTREDAVYSRAEWEALVQPAGECAWTARDLAALRRQQEQTAAAAAAANRRSAAVDFDSLRRDHGHVVRFCAQFPKGGILHEHAGGTMDRETAQYLLEAADPLIDPGYILRASTKPNVELYPDERAWVTKLGQQGRARYRQLPADDRKQILDFFFLPPAPMDHSFKRFAWPFLLFPLLSQSSNPTVDPELIQLERFLRRAYSMGVRYVELSKTLKLDSRSLAKLHEMTLRLEHSTGVTVRWKFTFVRDRDAAESATPAQRLVAALEKTPAAEIVGVDVVGNEETASALDAAQRSYATLMAAEMSRGSIRLHRAFHAGEFGMIENVRDALIMGAERLGHGVRLQDDPVTLEYARRARIGVEVAPVSNLRLRVVSNLQQHPFLKFLRLGLKVSLATDDEGVLETDMNNECVRVIEDTDVSYPELKQMSYNSIETAFVDDTKKAELLHWLDDAFAEFEKRQLM